MACEFALCQVGRVFFFISRDAKKNYTEQLNNCIVESLHKSKDSAGEINGRQRKLYRSQKKGEMGDGPSRKSLLVRPLTVKENGPARVWLQLSLKTTERGTKEQG